MTLLYALRGVRRLNLEFLFLSIYKPGIFKCALRNKSLFVEVPDALDAFTTRLLQKKSDKWGSQNAASGALPSNLTDPDTPPRSTKPSINNNVQYLTKKEIDEVFQDAVDELDQSKVSLLVKECVRHGNCPSMSVLVNILSFFSQRGDIEGINDVRELCKDVYPDFACTNSNFLHYLAEAIWLKGDVIKALELFDTVYRTNTFLRRRIRLTLRYLIYEAVTNRSEAVMVSVVRFCESLFKQYKDYYPLATLWQVCFLSEWHADQCIALKLMEKNVGFCRAVMNQVPYVVSASLKNHRTEPVYRLLEIMLKYDFKMQCSIVLIALFDYRYRQGDLVSCLEIYNWSMEYNVSLPTIQHVKFLKLLLNQNQVAMARQQTTTTTTSRPPKYNLKF